MCYPSPLSSSVTTPLPLGATDRQGQTAWRQTPTPLPPVQLARVKKHIFGVVVGLESIVSVPGTSYQSIDDALRSWLYLVVRYRDGLLECEDDIAQCSQILCDSPLFRDNSDYVRQQIIHSLLQEDEAGPLHVIANFLLLHGRSDDNTFKRMLGEGCFGHLLELIRRCPNQDGRLHRLLLELLYEMSRIHPLTTEDLTQVDDGLVTYLLDLIEAVSDDEHDPVHYAVFRVLLVLNEQYMTMEASESKSPTTSPPLTNHVIKALSRCGSHSRAFSSHIIILLNRETETVQQLLILKLLYRLFTTKATFEYFYTTDLHVLLDVIIRNLLDLPPEAMSLRHTYLRVLHPLLAHTQLSQPPYYKRDEIIRVLRLLESSGSAHFAPADETTLRLARRVSEVSWLADDTAPGRSDIACKLLGISLSDENSASNLSVDVIAAVTEKPGVKTPSLAASAAAAAAGAAVQNGDNVSPSSRKSNHTAPPPPEPRRRGAHRPAPVISVSAPVTLTLPLIQGESKKKHPPTAPPKRRSRLKAAQNAAEGVTSSESVSVKAPVGSTPVT